jgi:class 3 adenylate cyclase
LSSTQIVIEAVDKASETFRRVGESIGGVDAKLDHLGQQQKEVSFSARDLATGFSGMATSAFSLYMSVDRLERSQYAAEKANLTLQRATENLDQSQKNYNETVLKYGVNSDEAADASDKLKIAQEALDLATNRVEITTNDVNNTMMQSALMVIPSLITMVTSAQTAFRGLSNAGTALSGAMDFLAANPLVLVGIALAGLVAALALAYQNCQGFRNAVDGLGKFLSETFMPVLNSLVGGLTWLWQNVFQPFGAWLGGLFPSQAKATTDSFEAMAKALPQITMPAKEAVATFDAWTETLVNVRKGIDTSAKSVEDFAKANTLSKTVLQDYNAILSQHVSALNAVIDDQTKLKSTTTAVDTSIASLTSSYQTATGEINSQIQAIWTLAFGQGKHNITMEEAYARIAPLKTRLTELTTEYNTQIASLTTAKGSLEGWTKAAGDVTILASDLEHSFNLMNASANTNLSAMAGLFDRLFNAQKFEYAARVVQAFADDVGISFGDAEKLFDTFNSKIAEVPKTIQTSLVKDAQDKFAQFQSCMSDKAFTLQTDVTGQMATLASNITGLITSGLVGEAQREMQAYVDCNVDKAHTMAQSIDTTITALITKVTSDMAAMTDKEIADVYTKIGRLMGWQKMLGFPSNVELPGETVAGGAEGKWTSKLPLGGGLHITSPWYTAPTTPTPAEPAALTAVEQEFLALYGSFSKFAELATAMQDYWRMRGLPIAMGYAEGGIVTSPTFAMLGERGPEAVIPLSSGLPASNVYITLQGPLINVNGNMDDKIVDKAVNKTLDALNNVIVESSSSAAPATHQRIRAGSRK